MKGGARLRIVYGTKALTEDDLFDGCGRPRNILDFISNNLEDVLKNLRDAVLRFDHQGYQTDFRFDFIPLDLVEEYILYTAVSRGVELALDFMATRNNIDRSKHIASAADEKLVMAMSRYTDNDNPNYCNVLDAVCAAIIYDPISGSIKDICVCVPRKIVLKVEQDMEYCCDRCGKKQYSSALPEMMYSIKGSAVYYYCKECCNPEDVVSFVGDYWPPKE